LSRPARDRGLRGGRDGFARQHGGAPPLSPVVFLVKDGKVVGHITTDATKPEVAKKAPEPKQGVWSRLFRSDH
jgi:hypothetical protein